MKNWIITLPFLCATGVAVAQDAAPEGTGGQPAAVVAQAEAAATPAERAAAQAVPAAADTSEAPVKAKARSGGRVAKHSAKGLPTGDVRHCLDKKTRAEVIRCSETRPGK